MAEIPTPDPWAKPMNEWSIGDVEKALEAETTDRWTEGVCGDGAAILYDGVSVSISCVLEALNDRDNLRGVLAEISAVRTDSCLVHELVQQALGFDPDLDALEDAESHG